MVAGYKTQAPSQRNRSEASNFERTMGIKTKWTNAPILQCLTYVVCNFLHTRFDVRLCAFGMHIHEFTTFQNVQCSWNTSRQTNVHYFIIIIFNRVSCMATINFRSVSFAPKVLRDSYRGMRFDHGLSTASMHAFKIYKVFCISAQLKDYY